ncbi:MAG: HAMP domain-containing histidine kinase [Bacilli bacterium]|nr:HAMP domain-containing histidine kinase [Bacilli bacterium]
MNKKAHKNQNLYIKERIGITGLVMSVVLLFIFLIMMLVPYYSNRNMIDYTYDNVSKPLVTQSMNYLYGHASEQDIQNARRGREKAFVVVYDEDGEHNAYGEIEESMQTTFYEVLDYFHLNEKGTYDIGEAGIYQYTNKSRYYLTLMNADYAENRLDVEKRDFNSILIPIDIPNEARIIVGVDISEKLDSITQMTMILGYILAATFVVGIPLVYVLSYLVIRPTKNAIEHEKEFVANASHELKTPLAIITADAQLMKVKYPEEEYLSTIISQCSKMNETILDMIQLSRLEKVEQVLEKVNVSQLLSDVCMEHDAVAFEAGIDFEYDIQDDIYLDRVDRKNILRLFNLLLDNAMKYCEKEKKIKVKLSHDKGQKVFVIYNSGNQVHDEDREKVFERFYQGKSGTDVERRSSGLGLAIVKQICDMYNFQIRLRSKFDEFMEFTLVL